MKYCQKCRVMLKDEVEVCPICGAAQLPEEEFEAKELKKKKSRKTLIAVIAGVLAVLLIFYAVIMIFGKETKTVPLDEVYTEQVTDEEILQQFVSYVETAMPQVWNGTEEESDNAIEYYETEYPDLAAGFAQKKEMQPVVGELKTVTVDSAVKSEDGRYKLYGEMVCDGGKVKYELSINSSGYVDGLVFAFKEETFLQKAREYILEHLPEDM